MAHFPVLQPWEPPHVYHDGYSWVQEGPLGPTPVHNIKPKYEWVWPKDGKRGSKFGRMADILERKGPGIFIAAHGDKRDKQWNRPSRDEWSNWNYLDPWFPSPNFFNLTNFHQNPYKAYDFRQRRYKYPKFNHWTDVRWRPGAREKDKNPRAKRDVFGQWYEQFGGWGGQAPNPWWI
ncbi:MAG: hypothetical protein Q9165_002932 [Trypethelium subeluteriae]